MQACQRFVNNFVNDHCGSCGQLYSEHSLLTANERQVAGDHYNKLGEYQPWEVLQRWLTPEEFRGFLKGQAIVYLARERDKEGIVDVRKAEHYLQKLLEVMEGTVTSARIASGSIRRD